MSNKANTHFERAIFDELDHRIVHLFLRVAFYKGLFGQRETVELMNEYSPHSFQAIQSAMDHDFVRQLCAVTDPAKNKHQSNLTILQFKIFVHSINDLPLRTQGIELYSQLNKQMVPVRLFRDKFLVHHDLDVAMKKVGIAGISWREMDAIRKTLADLMNCIRLAAGDQSETSYEHSSFPQSGAIPWLLRDNRRLQRLRILAQSKQASDAMIRELCKSRSDRWDQLIFAKFGYSPTENGSDQD